MAYDGEIRFNTKIDNSNVQKDLNRIESQIRKSEESISKMGNEKMILLTQVEKVSQELEKATQELERMKQLGSADDYLKSDGTLDFTHLDEARKSLKGINSDLTSADKKMSQLNEKKLPFEKEAQEYSAQVEMAAKKLVELQNHLSETEQRKLDALTSSGETGYDSPEYLKEVENLARITEEITAQETEVDELQKKWEAAQKSVDKIEDQIFVVSKSIDGLTSKKESLEIKIGAGDDLKKQASEVDKLNTKFDGINEKIASYDLKIKQANADIERNTEAAAALSSKINVSGAKTQAVFDKAHNSAQRFGKRLLEIGKSALIFNVISSGLRTVVQYANKALKTNEAYTAQLAQLKGALLTAFQPIYEFVLPGLLAVLNVLTSIVQVVANVLSALTGKTAAKSAESAKALYDEAKAIGSVGSAAKKAQKSLASFDEINTIGSPNTGSGGGGSGAGTAAVTPDFSEFNTAEYKEKVDELTAYMSGALLALGAILAFSGANIPLGIGLMAVGAIGLVAVVKENWDAMSDELQGAITNVLVILGGAALAIGAILTFSGADVPKGIGLMIAGVGTIAGAVALNWDSISNNLEGAIATMELLLGSAVLALGAVLAFSGASLPLGIAMMALGAYAIYESTVLNWESISEALQGPLGKITAAVSTALLAIGAALAFSGANTPLGIALIAAGAAGLVTVAAVNWDTIQTALQGPIGGVTAIVSAALIAIGAILTFSGVNIPLGIALISAGAAGLVTVSAVNWNAIKDKLKEVWEGIKQWFNTSVKPKLTLSYWKEKFSNIGEGLKQKIKDGVNSGIALFNRFISWINEKMKFSWGDFSILGEKVISAGSFQLFELPKIPALAEGAVLPANKPFLAMVGDQKNGTNVEAPLETIKQALAEVMATQGTGDINITFTGELAALARVLKPYIDKENRRVGGSLVEGATYG